MDLFQRIKENVPIVSYLQSELGTPEHSGSAVRFNPCPFCFHRDCFTVYPKDNSFHCFSASCDRHGTLIDYEMMIQGISEPLEAAQVVARKAGISVEEGGKRFEISNLKSQIPREKPKKERAPLDPRLDLLRSLVADFYHAELLANPEALAYQREVRGHSLEVLTAFRVGYRGTEANLSNAMISWPEADHFTAEDLLAIGIIKPKKSGKGYEQYFAPETFVYPHTVGGRVAYFTVKPWRKPGEEERKNFQIYKRLAPEDWFCFNQDALATTKPVVFVEGENDLLSVLGKGGYPHVCAIVGNFNTSAILESIALLAKDRLFFSCFDRDEAGEKYTQRFGKAISQAGGECRKVLLPEGVKDIDDYLRREKAPALAFTNLLADAEPMGQGKPPRPEVTLPPNAYQFESFRVLGETESGAVVFHSNETNKTYFVALKEMSLQQLVQIGGEEVRRRVVRTADAVGDGRVHLYDLQKHLIMEARRNQLGPVRKIGQGVNTLDDGRLLVVNGAEAFLWDGKGIEDYAEPMIERKIIQRRSTAQWIDGEALRSTLASMTPVKAQGFIFELWGGLINQWGFEGTHDARMVTGFILAQMVQSIWAWRPHLWITGPQGCGKTILLDLVKEIGGGLAKHFEGSSTSEAGLRQGIRNDYVLAAIDEFERSDERDRIISYLRTAGRGGNIVKGSPGQEVIEYHLRHMVLVASIETGLVRAAEKTRFIAVELKKDEKRNPQMPTVRDIDEMRIGLFASALYAAFPCVELIRRLSQNRIPGIDPRLMEAYAVIWSMTTVFEKDPLAYLSGMIQEGLEDHRSRRDEAPEDEESILDAILNSTIRVQVEDPTDPETGVYTERSVSWLLGSKSHIHREDCASRGVWLMDNGDVFFATDVISRKLLRDTRWRDHDILGLLKRLPGMTSDRTQRNHQRHRGLRCHKPEWLELRLF